MKNKIIQFIRGKRQKPRTYYARFVEIDKLLFAINALILKGNTDMATRVAYGGMRFGIALVF